MPSCPVCGGALLVCEDHPNEPWPHDACAEAGLRCVFNPEGAVEWQKVFVECTPEPSLKAN